MRREARNEHRPMARLAAGLALLWILPLAPPAGAAPGLDPRTVAAMPLQELLDLPVNVASLAAESFVDAPSSVTVFTRQDIRNLGARTIEELLNYVPGMQAVRTASRSTYAVGARGRNSAQLSNDILFLLNGQRLNDDFSGAALLFNRHLATGNVQQVEVVRGPVSALYGSNAFLGVVNIVTSVELREGQVAIGSHDGREASLAVSGGDERYHASLFLSGQRDTGEAFADPTNPGTSTRDPNRAWNLYATFETGALRVDARHASFDADEFYLFRITPANPINRYDADDSSLRASYKLVHDDAADLVLSGGVRRIDNSALAEPLGAATMTALNAAGLTTGTAPFLGGSVVELTEWQLALDGSRRWGERHRLFGGVEFRHTKFDKLLNQNNYESVDLVNAVILRQPGTIAFYGDVIETGAFGPDGESREVFGAYVQDKIRLHDDLDATLGARLDHYSDFGSTVTPRAALVYTASADTTLKLMYGEAFRAPTVLELDTVNSPASVGNPTLEPERIRTTELAWLQEFGRTHFTLTGYYSNLRRPIIRVPVGGDDPRLTSANGPSIDLSGVELELHSDITRALSLRGAYAHSLQLATDPQTMPRNTAALIINHRHGPLNTNLALTYRDRVQTGTRTPEWLPSAWVANLNLRYALSGMTLLGGIYNLTDQDGGDFTQTEIPGGTPRRGRSFRLGLEFGF